MFIDLKDSQDFEKLFDVCILGAGPAGITIARKLAATNKKVLLLEAGDFSYREESWQLLECDSTGMEAWPQWKRQRFFGGTSNHWAGRCRPFEKSDFSNRRFGGLPGWPIQYSEIEPYLPEAMDILDISGKGFKSINSDVLGKGFVPDEFAKSPPTRFAQKYHSFIDGSENLICCLNANAVELRLNEQKKRVVSVDVKNYSKQAYRFKASIFILAMGGIENARFLLNQTNQIETGIGNEEGMVGKCFMEHLNVKLGEFVVKDEIKNSRYAFYTSDEITESYSTSRSNISLRLADNINSKGKGARIKSFFKNLACDLDFADKVQFISNFECPGTGVITTLTEQEPGKHSFVDIISEVDAIGLRKAVLNWELSESDKRGIRNMGVAFAKAFADSGIGFVKLENYILNESLQIPVNPHAHHMGTTRMAAKPVDGVVDSNCKVFTIDNLFVAGSSIFATGGACNPTMPLIQFALKLADHIDRKFTF